MILFRILNLRLNESTFFDFLIEKKVQSTSFVQYKNETNQLPHKKSLEACNISAKNVAERNFFEICPTIVDTFSTVNQSFEKRSCEILAVKTLARRDVRIDRKNL